MPFRKLAIVIAFALAAVLAVSPVYAHGFGERYDLPLPLNMFMIAAAAAVAASFVVIGLFVNKQPGEFRYPILNLLTVPALGAVLRSKVFTCAFKLLGVAVFLLLIATSLFGVNKPVENLSPTFVWIIWWVGMGYICALLGNFWMLVNPWRTMFEWVERFVGGDGEEDEGLLDYPESWGVWPAIVLFFIFAWLENVYNGAQAPFKLGLFILVYSAITWAGMLVFGKHVWLRSGEAFSVLFGLFARFSPTEISTSGDDLCDTCEDCAGETESCVDCLECFQRADPDERRFNLRPFRGRPRHTGHRIRLHGRLRHPHACYGHLRRHFRNECMAERAGCPPSSNLPAARRHLRHDRYPGPTRHPGHLPHGLSRLLVGAPPVRGDSRLARL